MDAHLNLFLLWLSPRRVEPKWCGRDAKTFRPKRNTPVGSKVGRLRRAACLSCCRGPQASLLVNPLCLLVSMLSRYRQSSCSCSWSGAGWKTLRLCSPSCSCALKFLCGARAGCSVALQSFLWHKWRDSGLLLLKTPHLAPHALLLHMDKPWPTLQALEEQELTSRQHTDAALKGKRVLQALLLW